MRNTYIRLIIKVKFLKKEYAVGIICLISCIESLDFSVREFKHTKMKESRFPVYITNLLLLLI